MTSDFAQIKKLIGGKYVTNNELAFKIIIPLETVLNRKS